MSNVVHVNANHRDKSPETATLRRSRRPPCVSTSRKEPTWPSVVGRWRSHSTRAAQRPRAVEDEINRRPRQVLADRTPTELFAASLASPSQPTRLLPGPACGRVAAA